MAASMFIQLPTSDESIKHAVFQLQAEVVPPRVDIDILPGKESTARGFAQVAAMFMTQTRETVHFLEADSITLNATFYTKHQLMDAIAALQRFSRVVTINATFGDTFSCNGIVIILTHKMQRFSLTDVGDVKGYPTLRGGDIVVWGVPSKMQHLGINMDCGISVAGECKPTLEMNIRGRSVCMSDGQATKIQPWVYTGHARAASAPSARGLDQIDEGWGADKVDEVPMNLEYIPRLPSDLPCFDTYLMHLPGIIYSPELADTTIAAFNALFGKCTAS